MFSALQNRICKPEDTRYLGLGQNSYLPYQYKHVTKFKDSGLRMF